MTRLIDADALINKYQSETTVDVFRYEVIEDLNNAPTVDATPVKHGEWLLYYETEQGRMLRCSECKTVFWVGDGREGNYCPNCGARMKGADDE